MVEPRFLSASDAARYLSVSVTQFKRLVEAGTLPEPVRLGKKGEAGERCLRWDRLGLDSAILGKKKADQLRSIEDAIEEITPRSQEIGRRNGQNLRV